MLRFRLLAAVGACALATSPTVAATAISYTVNLTGGTATAVNGTAGNSAAYTVTGSDGSTLVATITAWNATLATSGINSGKYVVSQAYLGRYSDGLGVTASSGDTPAGFGCSTAGACGSQQIDNVGNSSGSQSYDFIQISFSAPVTLATFTRQSQGTANGSTGLLGGANYDYDDDFSYGAGSAVSDGLTLPSLTGLMQTNVGSNGNCGSILNGLLSCPSNTATLTSDVAARTWFIGATLAQNYGGDNIVDSFKAQSLTASYTAAGAVPEPGTWAMMIFGFAGIGGIMRWRGLSRTSLFKS